MEDRQIEEVLKGDITTLNGSTKYLDFHCRLKDGTHCPIEFQFPATYPDDLERFFDYNITVEVTFGERAETIIFNFSASTKGAREKSIGETKKFYPKIFYLGDINFERALELIHIKLGLAQLESVINDEPLNIQLTYTEELHIMLMSLPENCKNKKNS